MKRVFLLSSCMALATLSVAARQPERGYRGFVDWTNRVYHQTDEFAYADKNYTWSKTYYIPGISTSHGYQFNPWLFAGAGIDFSLSDIGSEHNHNYSFDNIDFSIFGQIRTDLEFGQFTPFADLRLGWNVCADGTVYFSPSLGYRFNWGRKVGINVGLGYTLDAYRSEKAEIAHTPEGWLIYVPTGEYFNWNQSSFTFRVGFDF